METKITLNENGDKKELIYQSSLGSHNTFTYAKPKNIWHYFCIPFARCQNKDIYQQIKNGIRVFDIRCRFDGSGYMKICHGLFEVKLNIVTDDITDSNKPRITSDFKYTEFTNWILNLVPFGCIFRLVLETSKEDIVQELFFKNFCKYFHERIRMINTGHYLCGCVRKFDWKLLYDTKEPNLAELQSISSYNMYQDAVKARWYEKICPWLYAKRTNKNLLEKYANNNFTKQYDYILYDFV